MGIRGSPLQLSSFDISLDQGNNSNLNANKICNDKDADNKHAGSRTWSQHFLDCTRHGVEQSQRLVYDAMKGYVELQLM